MKFAIIITALIAGVSAGTLHARKGKGTKAGAATGSTNTAATANVQKGTSTLVFKETNGVPGNECLTFRNNGEIVDAACVNTAADRQITPSTLNGQNVLLVQRTFTSGFRPDLVNKEVCVGFNGTTFLAEDCASTSTEFVTFQNNQLVSTSGACQSGHDGAAQITVDSTGANCAALTTTTVTPTTS